MDEPKDAKTRRNLEELVSGCLSVAKGKPPIGGQFHGSGGRRLSTTGRCLVRGSKPTKVNRPITNLKSAWSSSGPLRFAVLSNRQSYHGKVGCPGRRRSGRNLVAL